MKQSIFLTIALLMASLTAIAHDFEVDGIYYNINGNEAAVTYRGTFAFQYDEYTGDAVIPESVTYDGVTYPVTTIGHSAFEGCSGMTSITIGSSVTSILERAFYGCYNLDRVNITDLAAWCKIDFVYFDEEFQSFVRPDDTSPFVYANHLYLNGEEVKDLVIPATVTSINNGAFYCCEGLTSVYFPSSVTTIGVQAFAGCKGLADVTFSNSISFGLQAFEGCSNLTSLILPAYGSGIGILAFGCCENLTTLIIPNAPIAFAYDAFSCCLNLREVYCYITDPSEIWTEGNPFNNNDPDYDYSGCTLYVPVGAVEAYRNDSRWTECFGNIVAMGDVDDNGVVGVNDVTMLIDILMGNVSGDYSARMADYDHDGNVTIADVVALIDALLASN